MRVVGIDIGFGQVKVVAKDVQFKFPSQIAQYLHDELSEVEWVFHDGERYVVGEFADVFKHKISVSSVDLLIRYAGVFVRYVLNRLGEGSWIVVSGLPPRFKSYSSLLESSIREVPQVREVLIVPQGVGVLEDTREVLMGYEDAIILDVGFNTVDYLAVRRQGGKFIKEKSGTVEGLGVKSAVEVFRSMLPSQAGYYRNEPLVFLVPYLLKGSLSVAGQELDLTDVKERSLNIWTQQLYSRVMEEVGDLLSRRSLVVVAGGGAYFISKKVFDREVFVPNLPEFSNARGYYKIGVQQML